MSTNLSFGSWLRGRRKELGVTQEELAERIDCSLTTIQKIEAGGRRPSGQIAHLLAHYFRVPADEQEAFVTFARTGRVATESPEPLASEGNSRAPWRGAYMHKTNLPAMLTPLIGREYIEQEIREMLLQPKLRLLTLSGAPGIGKTRLALQVASDLVEHFEDGAYLVDLAPVSDPDLVIPAIVHALGLRETAGQSIEDLLLSHIRGKRLLLLLDNFEQVLDAAPVVVGLMQASPWLKVLVTSREALHVRGERRFSVLPLELPDPKLLPTTDPDAVLLLSHNPAVELFVERTQATNSDFTLTAENAQDVAAICISLDGLPLAIELAAARAVVLSPRQIRASLDNRLKLLAHGARDLPVRQRTLREAIGWSYDLLQAEEQRIFRRMSVFVGGCTLEAAESVCKYEGDLSVDTMGRIVSLTDKSLLLRGRPTTEPRFGMLETVREYAFEQLEVSRELEMAQRRHAAYYEKLAEEAESQLTGQEQEAWLRRLENEHDNLRAALRWCIEQGEAEVALRLGGALSRFWYRRGHITEGRKWLGKALAIAEQKLQPADKLSIEDARPMIEVWAKALNGAGILASIQGDYGESRSRFEVGLILVRRLGDKQSIVNTLHNLGTVAQEQGDHGTARSMHEESLILRRELGDKRGIAMSLNNLGIILKEQGDYARAHSLQEEGLALRRELGDNWGVAMSLNNLGVVAAEQQDHVSARSYLEQSLALRQDLGDKVGIASCLEELGRVATLSAQGDKQALKRAAVLFGAAEALREALNTPLSPAERPLVEGAVAHMRDSLDKSTWQTAWAQGAAMTFEQAIAAALGVNSPVTTSGRRVREV